MTRTRGMQWRRAVRKVAAASSMAVVVLTTAVSCSQTTSESPPNNTEIQHQEVTFSSGGQTIVGDLYLPSDGVPGPRPTSRPAVVVTGSWTSVKDQMAGLYARELAERGMVALTFDFRNFGESGGAVRQLESPTSKQQDIAAAAEWLGQRPEVGGVGAVGGLSVCASAGYMAHAIADGAQIASFATVAAWLHDPASARTLYTPQRYDRFLAQGRAAQARFESTGTVDYVPAFSMTDENAAMQSTAPGYYGDPARGAIPSWRNEFAQQSWVEWLSYDALSAAPRITAPTVMVHSDDSALPDNARSFFGDLAGEKALYWMEGQHLNFYDQPDLVDEAADVVATHFHRTLGS